MGLLFRRAASDPTGAANGTALGRPESVSGLGVGVRCRGQMSGLENGGDDGI